MTCAKLCECRPIFGDDLVNGVDQLPNQDAKRGEATPLYSPRLLHALQPRNAPLKTSQAVLESPPLGPHPTVKTGTTSSQASPNPLVLILKFFKDFFSLISPWLPTWNICLTSLGKDCFSRHNHAVRQVQQSRLARCPEEGCCHMHAGYLPDPQGGKRAECEFQLRLHIDD